MSNFNYVAQDVLELHKSVVMGQEDVRPGCFREECVVVGETGLQGCNFTVFLPSSEVAAAVRLLLEVCPGTFSLSLFPSTSVDKF